MNQNANIQIEEIGPDQAKQLLDNPFPGQRPIRKSHVARLTQDMNTGHFRLTSDALLIIKGMLANGQHRLLAIVASGMNCQFLVLRTDDEKVFQVIDGGAPRRAADYLRSTDGLTAAGAAVVVLRHERDKLHNAAGFQITRTEQIEYAMENHTSIERHIEVVTPLYNQYRIMPKVIAVALIELARIHQRPRADEFVRSVYEGSSQDVAKDLREQLIANSRARKKMTRDHKIGLILKAYTLFLAGEKPAILGLKKIEAFPTLKVIEAIAA